MSAETARVLRGARALIDSPHLWSHHGMYGPNGQICMAVALGRANERGPAGWDEVAAALRRATGGIDIAAWNDAPGRTHAEVLAAFDAAIATEEARP